MTMFKAWILLSIFSFTASAWGKIVFLDVRTPEEFATEHIPGAININVENKNFRTEVGTLNKADDYKVYCRSGRRSAQAISIMKKMGFKNLENLKGLKEAKIYLDKQQNQTK